MMMRLFRMNSRIELIHMYLFVLLLLLIINTYILFVRFDYIENKPLNRVYFIYTRYFSKYLHLTLKHFTIVRLMYVYFQFRCNKYRCALLT